MKTYYYQLNEENKIVWLSEIDQLYAIDKTITSPTIELDSIEGIEMGHDKIINGKIVKHIFDNIPVELQPEEELQQIQQ